MEWLLERIPLVIAIVVVIVKVLQAVMQSRSAKTQHEHEFNETEEQRRVREIQERIRRSIAERRGPGQAPSRSPAGQTVEPPVLRQETVIDEDGDPFRDRDGGAPAVPPPQVAQPTRNFELERQEELAEKMRELAQARDLAARRAANAALMNSESAQASAKVRKQRFDDVLHDRDALRRAIVLREVLGPPVGLR